MTPVTHPAGRTDCLSAAGTRHELLLNTPANASQFGFAVSSVIASSLRLAGELALLSAESAWGHVDGPWRTCSDAAVHDAQRLCWTTPGRERPV